jgi:hypothetical protein
MSNNNIQQNNIRYNSVPTLLYLQNRIIKCIKITPIGLSRYGQPKIPIFQKGRMGFDEYITK